MDMTSAVERQALLTERLKEAGACLVGYGDVSVVKSETADKFPVALSIAVKYDDAIIDNLHVDEEAFHRHQLEIRASMDSIIDIAADLLRGWGYAYELPQTKIINSNEELAQLKTFPYKIAATCAGLGWIGKSDLLVTSEYGPRVRLAAILTDAPFKTAEPAKESRCGDCRACVHACPNQAIKGAQWQRGTPREDLLDAYVCNQKRLDYISSIGRKYACGHCMRVCPVGRKKEV